MNINPKFDGNAVLSKFYPEDNEYYAYLDTTIPLCNKLRRNVSLRCKISDIQLIDKLSALAGSIPQIVRLRYVVEYAGFEIKSKGNNIKSLEKEEDISSYYRLEFFCNLIDFDNVSIGVKDPKFI